MNLQETLKLFAAASTLTLMSGCSSPSSAREDPAIAVAKQEVQKKWGWKTVEVDNARLVEGRWIVNIWRLPKTPGGYATVEVSKDGKVLATHPGR